MRHLYNDNRGMALVICLLIMAVAAMIGIGISTDSSIDGQISRNQRDTKKDFFIADGSNLIKVASLLEPDGPSPQNTKIPQVLVKDDSDLDLPGSTTIKYQGRISYLFDRSNLSGYSIESSAFRHYYYTTKTRALRNGRIRASVKTTERKIGPGAGSSGLF